MDARRASRCAVIAIIVLAGCARIARPPGPSGPPAAPATHYEIVQGRNAQLVARLRSAPAPAQLEVSEGHSQQGDENVLRVQGYVQIGIGHFAERDPARARAQAE